MKEFCKLFDTAMGQLLVIKLDSDIRFMGNNGKDIYTYTEEFETEEDAQEFFVSLTCESVAMEMAETERQGGFLN